MTKDDMTSVEQVRWLDDSEQRTWRAFLAVHTQLTARLGRDLQDECGLSIADFSVLVRLSEHAEGRVRILELARALEWEKSRLSHQLTRMQQRGLLERFLCAEDRRGAFVVLTPVGRAALESAAPRHVESVRRLLFDRMDATAVSSLGDICEAVLDGLGCESVTGSDTGSDTGSVTGSDTGPVTSACG